MISQSNDLNVLYEDNHLIAIYKPPGISTQDDMTGDTSALELTKSWLKEKYKKPGNVFLGVIHRLDKPVGGVLLFGKTSKGASRLSEQFRERTVDKLYEALVEGTAPEEGRFEHNLTWSDPLRKALVGPEGKLSTLEFRRKETFSWGSRVEITLGTGRKHQIRCQFGSEKLPILGDIKYGAQPSKKNEIALVCFLLRFDHPITKEKVEIVLPGQFRLSGESR